jgi:two-component sensor histidine kinase
MAGLTQEQCTDFGWGDRLHPEDTNRTLTAWRESVRCGDKLDVEHRVLGVDDQWHHVLTRGVPIRNEQGEITCWAGINLDISGLKQAEEQIRASLAEKEVLLREVHHRVKNNLQVISSLVSLQAANLVDERTREVFGDVRDRVRTMALVHEKLYQSGNLAQLNFADYVTSLLHYLWRAHGTLADKVHLKLELAPMVLPVETAVPCGLILNELTTNALKHAFPSGSGGTVTVGTELHAESATVSLWVRDTGVGLPAGQDGSPTQSLGLRLVQILAGQLRGTVEQETGPGAFFKVTFRLQGVSS